MIVAEVSLRRVESPVRETTALFLAGGDRSSWLETIASWSLPEASQIGAELFALPGGRGVLVALPEPVPPSSRPSAVAFGHLRSASGKRRLLLPVDARLEPDVDEESLDRLLPHDVVVAHPSLGWFAFEAARALRLWSLLAFPPLSPARWRRPDEPLPWNRRIVSVSLAAEVSLEAFFGEEQGDIGAEAPDDLPPVPGEPEDEAMSRIGRKLSELAARGALAFSERLPGGATEPTWVDRMDDWARSKLDNVSRDLERLRHKELHRLLHLLDVNAEEGLRHALPLGEGALFRGRGRSSARLTERKVDFRLGALGGGHAVDLWDVPPELEHMLRRKYRELANHEQKLGRFRRAAYIYAELLGDLDAAASALLAGRHFREAAAIYRGHLGKPLEAAQALEAGGFHAEAVALYEELEEWERAGDLYRVMEKEEEARAAFELARDRLLAARDRLGASRIVEAKLGDLDEAIAIVETGWPDTVQAEPCLRRTLHLHATHARHAGTARLLDRLAKESTPPHLVAGLAACLAETATSYPDRSLRHRASDLTRRKIAARLPEAPKPEAAALVSTLYDLVPEDRLLRRDGQRFLASRVSKAEPGGPVTETIPSRASPEPVLVHVLELPARARYVDARSDGTVVFALGYSREQVSLVRARPDSNFQTLGWPCNDFLRSQIANGNLTLALDATGHENVVLHAAGCDLRCKRFPGWSEVFNGETVAGDPGWIPRGALALQEHLSCWLVARYSGERLILSSHAKEGSHLADVLDLERPSRVASIFLAAQNQFVALGVNDTHGRGEIRVYSFTGEERLPGGSASQLDPGPVPLRVLETQHPILLLGAAQPFTRNRLLVSMRQGLLMHWLDTAESCSIAPDLEEPRATVLRNGRLVVGSGRRLRVYRADPKETSLGVSVTIDPGRGAIVAVLPDRTPNQFTVLTEDGVLSLYRLPPE